MASALPLERRKELLRTVVRNLRRHLTREADEALQSVVRARACVCVCVPARLLVSLSHTHASSLGGGETGNLARKTCGRTSRRWVAHRLPRRARLLHLASPREGAHLSLFAEAARRGWLSNYTSVMACRGVRLPLCAHARFTLNSSWLRPAPAFEVLPAPLCTPPRTCRESRRRTPPVERAP
jgi:hypothetical protein